MAAVVAHPQHPRKPQPPQNPRARNARQCRTCAVRHKGCSSTKDGVYPCQACIATNVQCFPIEPWWWKYEVIQSEFRKQQTAFTANRTNRDSESVETFVFDAIDTVSRLMPHYIIITPSTETGHVSLSLPSPILIHLALPECVPRAEMGQSIHYASSSIIRVDHSPLSIPAGQNGHRLQLTSGTLPSNGDAYPTVNNHIFPRHYRHAHSLAPLPLEHPHPSNTFTNHATDSQYLYGLQTYRQVVEVTAPVISTTPDPSHLEQTSQLMYTGELGFQLPPSNDAPSNDSVHFQHLLDNPLTNPPEVYTDRPGVGFDTLSPLFTHEGMASLNHIGTINSHVLDPALAEFSVDWDYESFLILENQNYTPNINFNADIDFNNSNDLT